MTTIIGRVCIRKSDNKLIEFQSGIDKNGRKVLEENAVRAGYLIEDIEEKEVTAKEYAALQAAIVLTPEQLEQKRKSGIESEIRKKYTIGDEIGLLADVMSGVKLKDNPEIITWRAVVQAAKDKYPKPNSKDS